MAVSLNIVDWHVWDASIGGTPVPDVSMIPAILRRRLSMQGRAALSVMLPLTEQYGTMPIVYASRHGELERTLDMLQALAKNEPLSPTAFSLSVHNSNAGLFSILQKLTDNITAIAAGDEDLVPTLLEARGMLGPGTEQVLCVFSDAILPEIYRSYLPESQPTYALSFIVTAQEKLILESGRSPGEPNHRPQALQLLDFLNSSSTNLNVPCNQAWWQLQRSAS